MRYSIFTAMAACLLTLGSGGMQNAQADSEYDIVRDLYVRYLQREPEREGLRGWVSQLRRGASVQSVQAGILGSEEYYELHGYSAPAFVGGLYRDVLNRRASRAEIETWLRRLDRVRSRVTLADEFLDAARWEQGGASPVEQWREPIYVPENDYRTERPRFRVRIR